MNNLHNTRAQYCPYWKLGVARLTSVHIMLQISQPSLPTNVLILHLCLLHDCMPAPSSPFYVGKILIYANYHKINFKTLKTKHNITPKQKRKRKKI